MFFIVFSLTFAIILAIFGYFLPTIIAVLRNKKKYVTDFSFEPHFRNDARWLGRRANLGFNVRG